ncbi:MAG: arginine decarboxylase, pyruvoyl-dependent [Balneolales bacterium]|nr:arginine decarboxylase, pyruvoyl-dependent [Balneolales bacterium]
MMVKNPEIFSLVKGSGEGNTVLNAFDLALLNAGVGDTNLVRMSSIIPPNCELVDKIILPKGALIPVAYAAINSANPGEVISAAIGVGLPEKDGEPGLIMEFEDTAPLKEVEDIVRQMVVDGYEYRNRKYREILTIGIEHTVIKKGAVYAAAVLWYK